MLFLFGTLKFVYFCLKNRKIFGFKVKFLINSDFSLFKVYENYLFLQCQNMSMRKKNQKYRELVIKCLQNAGKPLWVREIARRTGLSPQTVTNILDELSLAGIIVDEDFARETEGKIKMRLVRLK